ncbi:MAG: SpaA isopeptide-forming pilin-related protein [Thomasclavelia sp.]|jgi:uncharacterized protein YegL|nr:SpaA isopeptide-forming pilin-related protein [Thomasclavelia sp.]
MKRIGKKIATLILSLMMAITMIQYGMVSTEAATSELVPSVVTNITQGSDKTLFNVEQIVTGASKNETSTTTSPVDVVLLFDTSGSMRGQKLIDAKNNAQLFTSTLFSKFGSQLHMSFITYDTNSSVKISLNNGTTASAVNNAIGDVSAYGSTNLGAPINDAAAQFASYGRASSTKVLIVLGDGGWNIGPNPNPAMSTLLSNNPGTQLFTIGYGSFISNLEDLANLAGTNGHYYDTNKNGNLGNIFDAITNTIQVNTENKMEQITVNSSLTSIWSDGSDASRVLKDNYTVVNGSPKVLLNGQGVPGSSISINADQSVKVTGIDELKEGDKLVLTYTIKINQDAFDNALRDSNNKTINVVADNSKSAVTFTDSKKDTGAITDVRGTQGTYKTNYAPLEMSKLSTYKDEPLEGAHFNITGSKVIVGGVQQVSYSAISNVTGNLVDSTSLNIIQLFEGTYQITETQAPNGHTLNSQVLNVTVDKNGKITYTDGQKIYNKMNDGNFSIHKTDEVGNNLEDVEFVLKDQTTGNIVDIKTTNANGIATFLSVMPGKYILIETDGPSSVVISSTQYEVTSYNGVITIQGLSTNQNGEYEIQNVRKTTNLGGTLWVDNNRDGKIDTGERLLSNTNVKLVDKDGNIAKDINGNPVASQVSDANGKYNFTNLGEGIYSVVIDADLKNYDISNTYSYSPGSSANVVTGSDELSPIKEDGKAKIENIAIAFDKLDQSATPGTSSFDLGLKPKYDASLSLIIDGKETVTGEVKSEGTYTYRLKVHNYSQDANDIIPVNDIKSLLPEGMTLVDKTNEISSLNIQTGDNVFEFKVKVNKLNPGTSKTYKNRSKVNVKNEKEVYITNETNHYAKVDPVINKTIKTGDDTNIQLLATLMFGSLALIVLLRRKKEF